MMPYQQLPSNLIEQRIMLTTSEVQFPKFILNGTLDNVLTGIKEVDDLIEETIKGYQEIYTLIISEDILLCKVNSTEISKRLSNLSKNPYLLKINVASSYIWNTDNTQKYWHYNLILQPILKYSHKIDLETKEILSSTLIAW